MKPGRNRDYLAFVRSLPCVVCHVDPGERVIESAHTGPHGLSQKASDYSAVPLCSPCHRTNRDSNHALGKKWAEHHQIDLRGLTAGLRRTFVQQQRTACPAASRRKRIPMGEKVLFRVGQPARVALATEGVLKQGRSGHFWTFHLADDRVMLVPSSVRDQIEMLGIRAGQDFTVTKWGGRLGTEWTVALAPSPEPTPDHVFVFHSQSMRLPTSGIESRTPDGSSSEATRGGELFFKHALDAAVEAAFEAQRYASASGYDVRFTSEDVVSLAI